MKKILSIFVLVTAFTLGSIHTVSANDETCGVNQCADCEIVTIDNELWAICPVYDETGARTGYKASRVKFGGGTAP